MSVSSWAFAKAAKLPAPASPDVAVDRDLETKMADGAVLLSDRWYSPQSASDAPVVLIRSPYGRRQMGVFGRLFAERGYQAVIQSCRGTFGSTKPFVPFRYERQDGLATLDWIAVQPWFTGAVATFGASYLGVTQWAVAGEAPDFVKAMAMQVTASNVRDAVVYPGGSFSLETGAVWVQQMEYQELGTRRYAWVVANSKRRLAPVYSTLPLANADRVGHGRQIDYYQEWLRHNRPGDEYWTPFDYSKSYARVPPSSHVTGWYDLFLPSHLKDYAALVAAGRQARLTVGPWSHTSPGAGGAGVRDAIEFFDEQLKGRPSRRLSPVRLYVMGAGRWVDVEAWPPAADRQRWHLHSGGRLARAEPLSSHPDRYLFDPADPTPALGGASLDPFSSGSKEQSKRELRTDVLTYTSDVLAYGVTVMGPVKAEVWMRSSRPWFDVFVRLCDVDGKGRSTNVCDGIFRVEPDLGLDGSDGVTRARVEMWPTARHFKAGHRLRLQISSAAHPLFARNPGSGEPLGSAVHLFASDQEIFHDPGHPSAVVLPVRPI